MKSWKFRLGRKKDRLFGKKLMGSWCGESRFTMFRGTGEPWNRARYREKLERSFETTRVNWDCRRVWKPKEKGQGQREANSTQLGDLATKKNPAYTKGKRGVSEIKTRGLRRQGFRGIKKEESSLALQSTPIGGEATLEFTQRC